MLVANFVSVVVFLSAAATPVVRQRRMPLATHGDDAVSRPTALSNAERRQFLTEHNRWRSVVRPRAGDMLQMVYRLTLFIDWGCQSW